MGNDFTYEDIFDMIFNSGNGWMGKLWLRSAYEDISPSAVYLDGRTGKIAGVPLVVDDFEADLRPAFVIDLGAEGVEYSHVPTQNESTKFAINAYANDDDMGSVTGGGLYDVNAQVTLKATPNDGYRFVRWFVNGEPGNSNPELHIIVTEDASFTAVFEEDVPNKGNIITIDDKDYLVLKTNGFNALLYGQYYAKDEIESYVLSSDVNHKTSFGEKEGVQYEDSSIDTFLSGEFYNSLSSNLKSAIVPTTITQNIYYTVYESLNNIE